MKTSRLIAALVLCATAMPLSAMARPGSRYDESTKSCRIISAAPLDWDSQEYGAGGKVFKSLCKSCHVKNNNKNAPFLWVESKTSAGWNRVFAEKYPKCAQDGSWATLTPDQLLKLNDYLYRFSSDSLDASDNC